MGAVDVEFLLKFRPFSIVFVKCWIVAEEKLPKSCFLNVVIFIYKR